MRLFYFLIPICFIQQSFALDCVSGAPGAGQVQINSGGVYNCDNLFITTDLNLTGVGGAVLEINVALDTQITANITLNGANGSNGNTAPLPGAAAGPGAGDGGGVDGLSNPENAEDDLAGNNLANGKAAATDICPNGGGGGGLFTAGLIALVCGTTATPPGAPGSSAFPTEFDFTALLFRGGYGGGSGGLNTGDVGTGGGGGGALHIVSLGNVLIGPGVTISARGGIGGNAIGDGGGGGGGSGGALWIEATGTITNNGTIDLRGSDGGRNNLTGAHGGAGGDGRFQFNGSNGTSNGTGLTPSSIIAVSTPSLKSDIACGTIAKTNEEQNLLFQIMMGFVFAIMIGLCRKVTWYLLERQPRKLEN
jgi:hypothetical protein